MTVFLILVVLIIVWFIFLFEKSSWNKRIIRENHNLISDAFNILKSEQNCFSIAIFDTYNKKQKEYIAKIYSEILLQDIMLNKLLEKYLQPNLMIQCIACSRWKYSCNKKVKLSHLLNMIQTLNNKGIHDYMKNYEYMLYIQKFHDIEIYIKWLNQSY